MKKTKPDSSRARPIRLRGHSEMFAEAGGKILAGVEADREGDIGDRSFLVFLEQVRGVKEPNTI